MPDNNISKAQPSKAKGLGGVFPLRSKNVALLYMYRFQSFCKMASKQKPNPIFVCEIVNSEVIAET